MEIEWASRESTRIGSLKPHRALSCICAVEGCHGFTLNFYFSAPSPALSFGSSLCITPNMFKMVSELIAVTHNHPTSGTRIFCETEHPFLSLDLRWSSCVVVLKVQGLFQSVSFPPF